AHRRAVDVVRRSARTPTPGGVADDLTLLDRDHDDDNVSRVDDHRIWDAVADLPAKQRVCVAYRYLGGLRYAEIAGLVGGTEAAARRAAADGVVALRRMIETERTS